MLVRFAGAGADVLLVKEGDMSVGEYCNRDVIVMGADESVLDAARLMREHHVGDVLIVEEREGERMPLGILTDRDLAIEVVAAGGDAERLRVADVMSGDLLTAKEEDDTMATLQRMRNGGVRRMPVVNRTGGLIGIITVDDFINVFAEQMEDLVRLVSREQLRERKVRDRP